jgi:hypothetical protein
MRGDHTNFGFYTWSHAIDDSLTCSPPAPQTATSRRRRSTSLFDVQRGVSERETFRSGLCQPFQQQLDICSHPEVARTAFNIITCNPTTWPAQHQLS